MILMMHPDPGVERPGSPASPVSGRWKAAGRAFHLLITVAIVLSLGNLAVASGPKVGPVKDEGGGDGPIKGESARLPEASLREPLTDHSLFPAARNPHSVSIRENPKQISDEQGKVESSGDDSGKSTLATVLNNFVRKNVGPASVPGTGNTKALLSTAESPSGRLSAARDIAKSALANILALKKSYEDGDVKAFESVVKSILNDAEPLIGAGESMGISSPAIDASDHSLILKGMSPADFIEYLRSHASMYDNLEKIAQFVVDTLDGLDLTLFSSEKSNTNEQLDEDSFEFETSQQGFKAFEFGSSARSWHGQQRSRDRLRQSYPKHMSHSRDFHNAFSGDPTPRHLGKLGLFNSEEVNVRHTLRLDALGDSCPKNCALTDMTCNCEKLFDCVSRMSAYDLAHLLSSGYVESDRNSDKYGAFTVESVTELKLFNAENGEGLSHMLKQIQDMVTAGPVPGNCRAVLQNFHVPCNPSKINTQCFEPNSQSFQATVDQVCGAVNTPTKLLFEAIGAEFDSFKEVSPLSACYPTSYATCGDFVKVFDRLYNARDRRIYPLENPMRKTPTISLIDMEYSEVFKHAEFPNKYVMSKDEYGVSSGFETIVSLMSHSKKVMSVSHCNVDSNVALTIQGSDSISSQFFLVGGKIISARCPSFALAVNDCTTPSALITLKAIEDSTAMMKWRFENDGVESIDCPGQLISAAENNVYLAAPSFTNKDELQPVEIAQGKSSSASSYENKSHKSNLAFDGKSSTRWSSLFNNDEYLQVDLGRIFNIARVEMDWEHASAASYKIQTSSDGQNFRTVWSTSGGKEDLGTVVSHVSVTDRYVRMQGVTRATKYGYSIYKMRVYGYENHATTWSRKQIASPRIISQVSTNKVMSVEGSCQDGTQISIQDRVPGHLSQQFYFNDDGTIDSVLCPNMGIAIQGGCGAVDVQVFNPSVSHLILFLGTKPSSAPSHYKWKVQGNGFIESRCPKFNLDSDPIGADATGSLSDPDAMLAGGKVTITSQSGNIYGTADSFFYASVPVSSTVFSLEVYSEHGFGAQDAHPWAKFGLMVRDDLTSASKYFNALWTNTQGVRVQYRTSESASAQDHDPGVTTGGGWMKVERNGNDFSAFFKSKTDSTYTSIGNKAIVMGGSVHIGVALSSYDGSLVSVTFSSFLKYADFVIGSNPTTGLVQLEGHSYSHHMKRDFTWSWPNLDEVFTLTNIAHKQTVALNFTSRTECYQQNPLLILQDLSGEKNQQFRFKDGQIISELCPTKVLYIDGHVQGDCDDIGMSSISLTDIDDCASCKWKFHDDGTILSDDCTMTWAGTIIPAPMGVVNQGELRIKSHRLWLEENFQWRLDKANYETSFGPDFDGHPSEKESSGCVKSLIDKRLANQAMSNCDQSMQILAGPQMSLGTLKEIVDLVEEKGPGKMPGVCCLDNALNSKHFGYAYDPVTMTCKNPGPWHLGLAEEICEAAGGQWTRTSCSTLKGCIDDRPKRFNLESTSTFDDIKGSINFGYVVAKMNDAKFLKDFGPSAPIGGGVIKVNSKRSRLNALKFFAEEVKASGRPGGVTCEAKSDCASNNCVGLRCSLWGSGCQRKVCSSSSAATEFPIGSPCTQDADCKGDAQCNGGSISSIGRCQQTIHDSASCSSAAGGESCSKNCECASNNCVPLGCTLNNCIANVCSTQSNEIAFPSGSKCTEDSDCESNGASCVRSGLSIIGVCSSCQGNTVPGGKCGKDCDCASNKCVPLACGVFGCATSVCSKESNAIAFPVDSPCTQDSDCEGEGGYCDGGGFRTLGKCTNCGSGTAVGGESCSLNCQCVSGNCAALQPRALGGSVYVCSSQPSTTLLPEGSKCALDDQCEGAKMWCDGVSPTTFGQCLPSPLDPKLKRACFDFCYSLPNYKLQVGMMLEEDAENKCVCLYQDGMAPKRELLPSYAARNPPTFYITDPESGSALGLPPGSECAETIGLELQSHVDGSLHQEFQLTYDGRLINLACPQYVLTAESNSGQLKAMAPHEELSAQDQQWTFHPDGMIKNVKSTDLLVSAAKAISSVTSEYFALVNPSTGLAIGVEGNCANGAQLVLQVFEDGNPHQNFKLQTHTTHMSIASVGCPGFELNSKSSVCVAGGPVTLISPPGGLWKINDNGIIESYQTCVDMVIGIDGTGSHSGRVKFDHFGVSLASASPPTPVASPAMDNTTKAYKNPKGSYVETKVPVSGTAIVFASKNSATVQKYQQWTQKFQRFQDLLGPFHFIDSSGHAIGTKQGSYCYGRKLQNQAYNKDDLGQKFYMGKHGSIFSAQCPGMVIGIAGGDCSSTQIGLLTYQSANIGMKWKHREDGVLESSLCPDQAIYSVQVEVTVWENSQVPDSTGMYFTFEMSHWQAAFETLQSGTDGNILDVEQWRNGQKVYTGKIMVWRAGTHPGNPNVPMGRRSPWDLRKGDFQDGDLLVPAGREIGEIALSPTKSNIIQSWRRENTRLLSEPLADNWITNWKVKFVEEGYMDELRGSVGASVVRHSYESNLAFSPSFEDFAKDLVVKDDKDEEQCRKAREGMGYDMDYPFDTDVCQHFQKWLCKGKLFSELNMLEGVPRSISAVTPKMIFTPIEYEKVKYDPASYDAPEYKDDDPLPFKEIVVKKTWDKAVSHEDEDKEGLARLQDAWLGLNSALQIFERYYDYQTDLFKALCDSLPDVIPAPMTCLPNLIKTVCKHSVIISKATLFAVKVATGTAENVLFNMYEKLTEGPDGEVYANDASRKTYDNLKNLDTFIKESLETINENIKKQHTGMRRHLQDRHLALETHLGQGLVDAQNALGQGIVDAQNANGQLVVNAQNSITGNLCLIYKLLNGSCSRAVGPLEEGQLIIPFDFYLPEGQLSLSETVRNSLSDIHEALVVSSTQNIASNVHSQLGDGIADITIDEIKISAAMMEEVSRKQEAMEDNVEKINAKVGAIEEKVAQIQGNIGAMDGKIGAMDGKIGAIEETVDTIEGNMKEMMKMMANMMDMMG